MSNYRRDYTGTVYFFTVVTSRRKLFLTSLKARTSLHRAVVECRRRYPFNLDGWVLLPDHLHCIWTLPEYDVNYSRRWSIIKRLFTQTYEEGKELPPPYWQARFWTHTLVDDKDYEHHLNYLHFNPVKHGYVSAPGEWPWTSLHRYIGAGLYPVDWAQATDIPSEIGRE
jgi:putative transposase